MPQVFSEVFQKFSSSFLCGEGRKEQGNNPLLGQNFSIAFFREKSLLWTIFLLSFFTVDHVASL